jgi:hypothetical protein
MSIAVTTLISIALNLLKLGQEAIGHIVTFIKNRAIRKKYSAGRDAARNGDIDELNDIFKGHKD